MIHRRKKKHQTLIMIKHFLFLLPLLLWGQFLSAQEEMLSPLNGNPVLIEKHLENDPALKNRMMLNSALNLPFYDDFSLPGPYPNTNNWHNSQSVYINDHFGIAPPTIGVATFDGLKRNGYPYNAGATSGSSFSDTLLSQPIRLDSVTTQLVSITPADSVYLSFYFQPKGRGDAPESGDQLYLDFYNPTFNSWTSVWIKNGYNPGLDSAFNRVMIPIKDTAYFKNGFRFRFRNKSTLCGAVDMWHIDQVYLNKARTKNDTLLPEIAFVYPVKSLLANYSQMPFEQFTGVSDMKSNIGAWLRNNGNGPVNITTHFSITDNNGTIVKQNTNGSNNLNPYQTSGYCNDPSLIFPAINYTYNNGIAFSDSTSYRIKFYVTATDTNRRNDTARYVQKFNNYFAYDDGSAEGGYGINAYNGAMAVKYTLNTADVLRSVDIFFDPIINVNLIQNSSFRIAIWGDNAGSPGNLLYKDSLTLPYFSTNGYNMFNRYQLSSPIQFNSPMTIYVGYIQTLNQPLNVGIDLNTNNQTKNYYNVGNGWLQSNFQGSLMIRPVFGDSLRAIGIKPTIDNNLESTISIFPNPASDNFTVADLNSKQENAKIQITGIDGKIICETNFRSMITLPVNNFESGIYFVKIIRENDLKSTTKKLIISR